MKNKLPIEKCMNCGITFQYDYEIPILFCSKDCIERKIYDSKQNFRISMSCYICIIK